MDCEMCGSQNPNTIIEVEGVQMNVCSNCVSHGTFIRRMAPPQKLRRTSSHEETELIESVHPDIAKLLKQHRERIGMTHDVFAKKLNIKESVYLHYESGSRQPSIETARKLEHEVKRPLVVRIKVTKGSYGKSDTEAMTFGDFIKKKKK